MSFEDRTRDCAGRQASRRSALNLHGTGLGDRGLPVQPIEVVTGAMWLKAQDTLRRIVDMAEEENVCPLRSRTSTCPLTIRVFHSDARKTLALVSSINHPRLRLNLDLYHAQIGEGNLIELCRKSLPVDRRDPGLLDAWPLRAGYWRSQLEGHRESPEEHGLPGPIGMEAWAAGDSDAALISFP